MTTSGNPYRGTPEITVLGQQGQTLRQLRYNRSVAGEAVDEQISRHAYDALVHLSTSVDARFFARDDGTLNFQYHNSLSGRALRSEGVDAGTNHLLPDIEGRPLWQRDARGTVQRYTYDELGRLSTRSEQIDGGAEQVRERLIYGESSDFSEQYNLRGRLAKHYDPAGLLDYSGKGYALSGAPLQQRRRLLPVETDSVWEGEKEAAWQEALEPETYESNWQYDADGRILRQVDAALHQQRTAYDVLGRAKGSWVTPSARAEQPVLRAISYNAAGQKLREEAGNGVVTDYRYEPETQRLLTIETRRPQSAESDGTLQQLRYEYDPVGNITAIHNDAENPRFFRNQQVTPSKTYRYDALYQLISTCGRENASVTLTDVPEAIIPIPVDTANYTNYTRAYSYDRGGNLTQIQHQGNNITYNRNIMVSESSNHGLHKRAGMTFEKIESMFDVGGNQTRLETGQYLVWNGLNQLQKVMTSLQENPNDGERYCYGGDGMRVRKNWIALAGRATQSKEVIYLPGLELRRSKSGDRLTESLEVVTIGAAGRCQVRLLNWIQGKPKDIANQQMRYSLDDHLGSSQLELDGDGNVLTREEYFPYGGTAVRAAKSGSEAKYKTVRYAGKERDASGLYYYGFRYYQPWLGRWLSTDPAGAVDGLNLYAFVGNNPSTFIDPSGMWKWLQIGAPLVAGALAGLAGGLPAAAVVGTAAAAAVGAVLWNRSDKASAGAAPAAAPMVPAATAVATSAGSYKTGLDRQKVKGERDPSSRNTPGITLIRPNPKDPHVLQGDRTWSGMQTATAQRAAAAQIHPQAASLAMSSHGHQIAKRWGGPGEQWNAASATNSNQAKDPAQEDYQTIVENAIDDGPGSAVGQSKKALSDFRIKHTAYLYASSNVAKHMRIKVYVHSGGTWEKRIDQVTGDHQIRLSPAARATMKKTFVTQLLSGPALPQKHGTTNTTILSNQFSQYQFDPSTKTMLLSASRATVNRMTTTPNR